MRNPCVKVPCVGAEERVETSVQTVGGAGTASEKEEKVPGPEPSRFAVHINSTHK